MANWATDTPAILRRAHRGEARGTLPPDTRVHRIKGALIVEPEPRCEEAGTLLWWHGGGFVAGHPLRALAPAAWIAKEAGLRAVLPLWPLAPEAKWPAQADHARAWCNRIEGPLVVGGDSAGGALALACTDHARALILGYPALGGAPAGSVAKWGTVENGLDAQAVAAMYTRLGAPDLAQLWRPGLPPCLVLTGDQEPLADDLKILATLGTFETHVTTGAEHGFLRCTGQNKPATDAALFAGRWLASLKSV